MRKDNVVYTVFRAIDRHWDVYEATFAKESDADAYVFKMSKLNPQYRYRFFVCNVE